jgi:hypothetical protein
LVSLAKKIFFFIANFHVLGLFNFRLSRGVAGVAGVAVGFWTKFGAQLAQPC